MSEILCKTKGNARAKGKPRVFFTSHPDDFSKYFDKICEDIFSTHNCAIYYTKDLNSAISDEDKETDLGSNNLFVVPVTKKLLTTKNRAMDIDITYAIKNHIPVLPLMMEKGLDEVYSKKDKFGDLQYLSPYADDSTEISYEEKLKKYLDNVLISDELANRVRAAFDAYIFLSYRKKDRRYANELMKIIHANREYRDIAIWFDEFLTPGESFKENINTILNNSKLFALLVTPSILEEPDGKPNFVMGEEYPAAKASGITILPTEMKSTDKKTLSEKFTSIPECVNPKTDHNNFKSKMAEALSEIAITTNDDNPEHNFLVGIAYLEGIDVEVDRKKALTLITSAAEAGLTEAMSKLYKMYKHGIGVGLSYKKSLFWIKKLTSAYEKEHGEENEKTLKTENLLALAYGNAGDFKAELETNEKVYNIRLKLLGEDHKDTLTSLHNLALSYTHLGNFKKAAELNEIVYHKRCKILGKKSTRTLTTLANLAESYKHIGNYEKGIKYGTEAYEARVSILGEENSHTLISLNNLAVAYNELENYEKGLELSQKAYNLRVKTLGEEHPDTLVSLNTIATAYSGLKEHDKALEIKEKVYNLRLKVLGENHPRTLISLNNLASEYAQVNDLDKALTLTKDVYERRCKVLGESHPNTINSLNNLATCYEKKGDIKEELSLKKKVYELRIKALGDNHPTTLISLNNYAYALNKSGKNNEAILLYEKAYAAKRKIMGKDHKSTIITLDNLITAIDELAATYTKNKEHKNALGLYKKLYYLYVEKHGKSHEKTLSVLKTCAKSSIKSGKIISGIALLILSKIQKK